MTDVLASHSHWSRRIMPEVSQQKNTRRSHSRPPQDISRTITLYRNGDRYFTGKQIALKPLHYTDLRDFLQELSSTIDLPYGVRRLFTPRNGSEVSDINILKDGASYVCASFEPFQRLEYTSITLPRLTVHIEQVRQPVHDLHSNHRVNVRHLPALSLSKVAATNSHPVPTGTNRFHANNIFLQSLTTNNTNSIPQQQPKKITFKQNRYGLETLQSKPKTITIVKQGNEKPHKTITILLNRRTGQTFEQLLSDVSEAFGYQKHRTDKIKRLFTLKGRQVYGINDFFRDDDVFIAATHNADIPSTDLQEISLEVLNDLSHATARRHHPKQPVQSPVDYDTPTTQLTTSGPITIDVKKTVNIRDSGFLDDEDGLSGRDSEITSMRPTNPKRTETVSEDAPTPTDLITRKLKKSMKSTAIPTYEQQRERERQRLREEEERRRKLTIKKEQQQQVPISAVPKFEQLVVDVNNEESSRSTKTNTGTAAAIAPVPRSTLATHPDENQPPPPAAKQVPIKKRSSILHTSPAIVTDKYEFGKKMGDGNFAIVRRSKLRGADREVAIKIIDKSKMKGKECMLDHEINIMYICNHPNIIRLFEDYETADEIYLIMELIKGGDLFDYITKHRRFDESVAALMIRDVAEAILYLHTKNIVHRDLKPENLLVMQRKDGRITIKLTDFGLAMHVTEPIKTVCGTPTYVAPEILAETGYGMEVDCWAIGIILYILLCGYPPFKTADRNQEELFQMIQRGKFTYDSEYWSFISMSAKNLIDHLLVVDHQKRMRANDILLHPWIMSTGQSKSLRNVEELRTTLRTKYEAKIKEYAMENSAP